MSLMEKRLTSVVLLAVGLLAAAFATRQFYLFVAFRDAGGVLDAQGGGLHLLFAIAGAVVACVCVFFGIFRRINKTEEFHITT
jgi:uncharacterized membrane protein